MIPQRFIYRSILFLVFAVIVGGVLHRVIWAAFLHNPWLNGVIMAILLFGIFFNVRRILRLRPEARWIDAFRTSAPGFSLQDAPRLLAPIAAVLGERQRRSRTALTAVSLRHLLDSIGSRLDENRDISAYLRNLLIFLGLLGTFWGLIQAIGAIGGVIGHEITHGFDSQGRQYDPVGNVRDWWAPQDAQAFNAQAARLVAMASPSSARSLPAFLSPMRRRRPSRSIRRTRWS